jgi:hypothetical protein
MSTVNTEIDPKLIAESTISKVARAIVTLPDFIAAM